MVCLTTSLKKIYIMLDLNFTSSHVDKILEVLGVEKNDESCVHDLLHHMYVAVYMFQQMGDRDRAYVVEMQKKMKAMRRKSRENYTHCWSRLFCRFCFFREAS